MAFDGYLKVDGIDGESPDSTYTDWIEVISYRHEIIMPATQSAGGAGFGITERANHGLFIVEKWIDKATPKLAQACCAGDHIDEVILSLNRAAGGGDRVEYMNYKLTSCFVAHISPTGDANSEYPLPRETIGFFYGQIEWTYNVQDATGAAAGSVQGGWNAYENASA